MKWGGDDGLLGWLIWFVPVFLFVAYSNSRNPGATLGSTLVQSVALYFLLIYLFLYRPSGDREDHWSDRSRP